MDYSDLADSLRVEEIADELGIIVTSVVGDEHWAHCPYPAHGGVDRNPSFSFNVDKGVASCFSCGSGGNMLQLVCDLLEVDRDTALEWLVPFSDYAGETDEAFIEQVERAMDDIERTLRPEGDPLPWFPTARVDAWCEAAIRERADWFESRRISLDVARRLKLGLDHEHQRAGYTGPAIIIPHFVDGQCAGWQERWERHEGTPSSLGKYTNSPGMPRDVLYAFRPSSPIIVVESPLTVARLMSMGLNATATFGAKVSERHIRDLRRCRTVYLAFDNDDSGDAAVESLMELDDYVDLLIVPPPAKRKADLGDVDDDEVLYLLDAATPALLYEGR